MSKFKVGDVIRCIKDKDYIVNRNLIKARIVAKSSYFTIEVLEYKNDKYEKGVKIACLFKGLNFDDYFELYEENELSYNFKLTSSLENEWDRLREDLVLDNERFYEKYIKGIWENEEENEMRNEVLELWYKRKGNDIEKKYDELESKYIDEKYSVVKSYEDMIGDFERQLEDLYKYNNASEQFVLKENNGCNVFKYVLDEDKLVEEAEQFYKEDKTKEMQEVLKEYNEIKALLSMSDDLEYQQSILIEYKIIDKKTKRMI